MLEQITPIVLAGGRSSRMRQDKSFVSLADKPLIERVLDGLRQTFSRLPLLVTNRPDEYAHLGFTMVGDKVVGQGPLGGIHAGLCRTETELNFIVACDMPFLQPAFIRYMAEQASGYQVTMPKDGDATEALHAFYTKDCIAPIEACLAAGGKRRIVDFLPQVKVRYIEKAEYEPYHWAQQPFFNVNNSEDLLAAQRLLLKREKFWGEQEKQGKKEASS